MKKLCFKFLLFFLISTHSYAATQRAYSSGKSDVWRALLISLSNYPLEKNDYENGEVLTSKIPEGQQWRPFHKEVSPRNTYTMRFLVYEEGKNSTVVVAEKKMVREGNFLDAEKEIKTKDIETSVILYRTQRELVIDKYIKKAF